MFTHSMNVIVIKTSFVSFCRYFHLINFVTVSRISL